MAVEFDWGKITGEAVDRLTEPKLPPRPPEHIVKLAQAARTGVQVNGKVSHNQKFDFPKGTSDEVIEEFVRLLKASGRHVSPEGTITAKRDPGHGQNGSSPLRVGWTGQDKRGAKV